jgi:PadR family transcriptional regulator PadR
MNPQFKRGIVELCILKLLSKKEMSTYEILELISKDLQVNENTVYPILRRLTKENVLNIKKSETSVGAPRKLYYLTSDGLEKLETQESEWLDFLRKVTNIMEGNYE